ncbi:MAG: tRNA uridine-5-carboxymethylaminomethyl(34) synthesis enzyme MnmG [Mycoplasmataceae bacterium]|nr:tRNA uridine-5-carboxymethylaminomethyl(34) synthesis enzyme MnmG [Mycoplasmataceae bacterium]
MNMKENIFDAIVVGGGHAGIEAAFALAKQNFNVALITLNKNKLASMPCNPSIGGPAKGIITREIDALGGVQAFFADLSMIQVKMLNESKGPAVRAIRAQIDKDKFSKIIGEYVENNIYITVIENMVDSLIIQDKKVKGVTLNSGINIFSKIVIITTGTYMDSKVMRGNEVTVSGPDGDSTSSKLSENLKENGFDLMRLKTGTPARVFANSIDFSEVEKEVLGLEDLTFSDYSNVKLKSQTHCFLTYTNEETHKIILDNLDKSSMYSGLINGVGPRYCPSIEDKIVRFQDKKRHQIFFEPETSKGDIFYINGLSTSMPIEIQNKFIRTIPGLKNANVSNWGYAIEYDAINSLQIKKSLESKIIENLFFAGQINGTSGYEEAAAQGLVAGINASLKILNKEPLNLLRSDSYIGVLIDDLTLKGTKEPYRMLTSRAEYRLLLRNDNADIRLAKYALDTNMITKIRYEEIIKKYLIISNKIHELKKTYLSSTDPMAVKLNIFNGQSFFKILSRPEINVDDFIKDFKYKDNLLTHIRLEGYIKKQNIAAKKMIRLEFLKIPQDIVYNDVKNLATEAKQKLTLIKPETLGQAYRISGINPADIEMLLFYINTIYTK